MSAQVEAELVALSEQKWQWMSQRQIEPLQDLFHEAAVFVHMGATMTKDQEIEVIRSGQIHYRDIEIKETSVRFIGDTAILLNRLQLTAVIGGDEVTNPFVVTEVYVDIDETWKLASLSFTRLVTH
jgi:translation elongation factor EF-4